MFNKMFSIACGAAVLALTQPLMAVTITAIDGSQSNWIDVDTRTGGVSAIANVGGQGALYLSTDSTLPGGTSQAKVSVGGGEPIAGLGKLSELTTMSFDWYRDSASSDANTKQLPGLRLVVRNTNGDINELVWEWAENSGAAATEDAWVTQDLFGSAQDKFWSWSNGVNFFTAVTVQDGTVAGTPANYRQTLEFWAGGGAVTNATPTQSVILDPDSVILGVKVGMGSGIAGQFYGAVDNIKMGFTPTGGGSESFVTYDFELPPTPTPTPEPATAAMGLLGMAGLAVAARRRRKA